MLLCLALFDLACFFLPSFSNMYMYLTYAYVCQGDVKRTAGEREKLLVLLSKDALQVILDASL